jgi:crotonobetainyl-CoA:carnitine CoA-transferase CaiB-like acyl-CoA transferase
VLVESYRPGVLEKNNLGPEKLFALNPELVVLRVSGYGQTGPYNDRPGFGKVGEAFSGFCDLTGPRDGPPTHAGFPMADMTTGLMGAFGIMIALHALREGLAKGQVIDLALYETPLRLIDFHVPVRTGAGLIPKRNGNRHPLSMAMSGMYKSADEKWITYSAGSFTVAKRVLRMIGGDALADDPRFTDLRSICRHDDEINHRMTTWFSARTAAEALKSFKDADAVAECVYEIDDILSDPHVAARANIANFSGEDCRVVNVVPKLSVTPGQLRWLGRDIGHDSVQILRSLQFSENEIAELLDSGAVCSSPNTIRATN